MVGSSLLMAKQATRRLSLLERSVPRSLACGRPALIVGERGPLKWLPGREGRHQPGLQLPDPPRGPQGPGSARVPSRHHGDSVGLRTLRLQARDRSS